MTTVFFQNNFEIEIIIRMICAAICGFVLGIERSRHGKAAGIRTYMVVSIGACIFAIASKYGFSDYVGMGRDADVARVASNIVSGVSFLGAGTILIVSDRVTGLTTAAGIWAMAAIGTAFGTGMYIVATIATLYIFVIQNLFHNKLTRKRVYVKVPGSVDIVMDSSEKSLNKVLGVFEKYQMDIDTTGIERHKDDSLLYRFAVNFPESTSIIDVVSDLSNIKNVQSVDM
ncbi:MAG: MgtC/SapB family protein [Pseudobutyrivibrio sp.]|nr:MgtC/SapB family protein [Pseudobutyrivibrio sp.]